VLGFGTALAVTVGCCFGFPSIYRYFGDDFSKPLSVNAIGELLLMLIGFGVLIAIIAFAWATFSGWWAKQTVL
jgi:hypothetical protein